MGRLDIGLFAKAPRLGAVKSRLVPPLDEREALDFYLAGLRDTWEAVARGANALGASATVLHTPPDAGPELCDALGDVPVAAQAAGPLDVRLERFFAVAFLRGAGGGAIAVGADHPGLPDGHLASVARELERADVVLGPSSDGGYWAIAVRRRLEAGWLAGVPWSTPDVLEETRLRAGMVGATVALARPWFDVDREADLGRLRGVIAERRGMRRADFPRHCAAWFDARGR